MSAPRVRFAPAPTGFLHVGSARTALFNWLFARRHGGELVLRVEDTDEALRSDEYVDAIIEPLRWLGLDWDVGPVFQSQRRDRHDEAIERLVAAGDAYYCDLTRDDVERLCNEAGLPVGYHGWSRERDVSDGPGVVVRFRCGDEGETVVEDIVRGRVDFPNESLEDFVIRRGDGSPTFHLANAVDDNDMGISHVIRGEDLLNTTPRVMLLWRALGYGEPPQYAHLPLLVNAKRQKLSKRRDDVALHQYRKSGYLPEAMVNYLALLGWGPPDEVEVRPISEIAELFDLADVNRAPAYFDLVKLDSINAEYIKSMSSDEFADRVEPFLKMPSERSEQNDHLGVDDSQDSDRELAYRLGVAIFTPEEFDLSLLSLDRSWAWRVAETLAPELQQRTTTLDQAHKWVDWLLTNEIVYEEKSWRKAMLGSAPADQVLARVIERLADDDFTSAERLESIVMGVGDELSEELGQRVRSQPPVRVALTGTGSGLPLWNAMVLLGGERTLARLRAASDRLSA